MRTSPIIKMPFRVWGLLEDPRLWKHVTESSPILAVWAPCHMEGGLGLTTWVPSWGYTQVTQRHSQAGSVDTLCVPRTSSHPSS